MTLRVASRVRGGCGLLVFAGLLGCTVEYPLERRMEMAAPVSLAEACSKLLRLLPAAASTEPAGGDLAPGSDDRRLAYEQYCQPAPGMTGWENCAQPGAGPPPPSCSGPVLPYLVCLADPARVPVSECAPLAPTCAPPAEVQPRAFDAAQACEIGVGFDGRGASVFAYTVTASDCSDGNSYGFTCEPPSVDCVSSCACSRNAVVSARIRFDVSTEIIDQTLWEACGLPALVSRSP